MSPSTPSLSHAAANPTPADLWRKDPGHWLALGLGTGLSPRAPGTCGSVLGVLLHVALCGLPEVWHWSLIAGCIGIGVPLCGRTARALGVHDHPAIVWDEIAAMPLVLVGSGLNGWGLALGFGLFRLFDIWKPWPIKVADRRIHGGLGIMLDDVLAAGAALAVLEIGRRIAYF